MAELVKERRDLAVLHQSRLAWLAAGEVADQGSLGQLLPLLAVEKLVRAEPLVLAGARVHVEIDPPQLLVAVVHVKGADRWVPNGRVRHWFEGDVKQLRCDFENSSLHPVVGEVRPRGL